MLVVQRVGGGGICNKTAHQIRVRVNACAVHAYISCERMRSACLKFVPQTWWWVRAAATCTAYRSARCAAADFRGSFFVDVMSVTCLFFFFFAVLWSTRGTCRSTALWFVWNLWEQGWQQRLEKLGQLCNVEDVRLVDRQSEFDNVEVSELSWASFVVTVDRRDF